jgi:hypothetical protein
MTTLLFLLNETRLPKNEARIVLAHLLEIHLQLPKSALLTHDGMEVSDAFLQEWQLLEQRRLDGAHGGLFKVDGQSIGKIPQVDEQQRNKTVFADPLGLVGI